MEIPKIPSHRPQLRKGDEDLELDFKDQLREEAADKTNVAKASYLTEEAKDIATMKSPDIPKTRPSIAKRLNINDSVIPIIPSHHPKGHIKVEHKDVNDSEAENKRDFESTKDNDAHTDDGEREADDEHESEIVIKSQSPEASTAVEDTSSIVAPSYDTSENRGGLTSKKPTLISTDSMGTYDAVLDVYKEGTESLTNENASKDDEIDANEASKKEGEIELCKEDSSTLDIPTPRPDSDSNKNDARIGTLLPSAKAESHSFQEGKGISSNDGLVKSKTQKSEDDSFKITPEVKKSKTVAEISLGKKAAPSMPKKRPLVPKKPSSKIAQFQAMLQKQQKHDMEILDKSSPTLPSHRPRKSSGDSLGNGSDEQKKDVSKTEFSHKLNSMFGMKMNGIPLPGMVAPELKSGILVSKTSSSTSEKEQHNKPLNKSLGSKRRVRAPRGRRLPKSVENVLQVNDETLGTKAKFTVFAENSWKMDFFNPDTAHKSPDTRLVEMKEPGAEEVELETSEETPNSLSKMDERTAGEMDGGDIENEKKGNTEIFEKSDSRSRTGEIGSENLPNNSEDISESSDINSNASNSSVESGSSAGQVAKGINPNTEPVQENDSVNEESDKGDTESVHSKDNFADADE